MLAQIAQVKKPVDPTQQVIARNISIEIERIKQLVLHTCLLPHHLDVPLVVDLGI